MLLLAKSLKQARSEEGVRGLVPGLGVGGMKSPQRFPMRSQKTQVGEEPKATITTAPTLLEAARSLLR